MLSVATAKIVTVGGRPPPTPSGCAKCRQQKQDLLDKALERVMQSDQVQTVTYTSSAMASPEEMIKHEIIEGRPRRYCEGCGRRNC